MPIPLGGAQKASVINGETTHTIDFNGVFAVSTRSALLVRQEPQ